MKWLEMDTFLQFFPRIVFNDSSGKLKEIAESLSMTVYDWMWYIIRNKTIKYTTSASGQGGLTRTGFTPTSETKTTGNTKNLWNNGFYGTKY